MNFSFKNKKILITGSSGGIGASLCSKFISLDAQIIITSSSEEKLVTLKGMYGSDHKYFLLNLSDINNLSDSIIKITNDNKDIKNRSGSIIGISSVVAATGNPGQANYTASKAGMISMYKSLALEVAQRNININLIAPGFIESPMTNKLNDEQKNKIMDQIPMKKFGSAEEIANLAVFLASDYSSYITGQTFHVNGGMLML